MLTLHFLWRRVGYPSASYGLLCWRVASILKVQLDSNWLPFGVTSPFPTSPAADLYIWPITDAHRFISDSGLSSRSTSRDLSLMEGLYHSGYLLMREVGVGRGSKEGEGSKDGGPPRPKNLPLPICLFLGAVLIGICGRLVFYAFDVAGTGSFLHASLTLCAGGALLYSGAFLILVTLGVW